MRYVGLVPVFDSILPLLSMTSLSEELKKREVDYSRFTGADEHFRKLALKEEYDYVKGQYQWQYDQPITKDLSGTKKAAAPKATATKKKGKAKKRSLW
jgi:hypothetical protein